MEPARGDCLPKSIWLPAGCADGQDCVRERLVKLVLISSTQALLHVEKQLVSLLKFRLRTSTQLEDGSYWHQRPQIRTLLLATIPRCVFESPFRHVPKSVLQIIAAFVPQSRANPKFQTPAWGNVSDDGRRLIISAHDWSTQGIPEVELAQLFQGPGIEFFVFRISHVWFGSEIQVHDLYFSFTCNDECDERHKICILRDECKEEEQYIECWDDCWEWGSSVEVGILLDLTEGFVTFVMHRTNGPRFYLGSGWETGVRVALVGEFPEEGASDHDGAWSAEVLLPRVVPKSLHLSAQWPD